MSQAFGQFQYPTPPLFATLDMMRDAINAATPAITAAPAEQLTKQTLQALYDPDTVAPIVKPRNQTGPSSHAGKTAIPRLNTNLGILRRT
jgi:hypothetical protein